MSNTGMEIEGTAIIQNSTIAGTMIIYESDDKAEDDPICPFCYHPVSLEAVLENHKVECTKCSKHFFEYKLPQKNITKYLNVPPEQQAKYDDLFYQLFIVLKSRLYPEAKPICEKAFDLFPMNPEVLQYRAWSQYFNTPREEIIQKDATSILVPLRAARELDPMLDDKMASNIAFKYFRMLKYRIAKSKSWKELSKLVAQFSICYEMYPEIEFLKTQIQHLSGQAGYCWLLFPENGHLDDSKMKLIEVENYKFQDRSSYSGGILNQLSKLELRIKQIEPHYVLPKVRIEYQQQQLTITELHRQLQGAQWNWYLKNGAILLGIFLFVYFAYVYWETILQVLTIVLILGLCWVVVLGWRRIGQFFKWVKS